MDLQPASSPLETSQFQGEDDEQVLVQRAKADPGAFGMLYRRHYRAVAGCIYRRVGDVHTTEDLAADVFIRAFKGMSGYRQGIIPFRFWLYRIATNVVSRWAQRQRQGFLGVLLARSATAEAAQAPSDEILAAMRYLNAAQQGVVSLHYFEDLTVQEVATVLGCSVGTVKSRLSRARERLRDRLAKGHLV